MSFAGGRACKLGNRYERLWVARQLLIVLSGDTQSVCVEAIGDDEHGVDLWVRNADATRDAHQCKRKHAQRGHWTLGELERRQVLQSSREQLERAAHHFLFVSADNVPDLRNLRSCADSSNDDAELFLSSLSGQAKGALETLARAWKFDLSSAADLERCYGLLRRFNSRVIDDEASSYSELERDARYYAVGDGRSIVLLLCELAEVRMGNEIYADEIWAFLKEHGCEPRRLDYDSRVAPRIAELCDEYRQSQQVGLIARAGLMARRESQELIGELQKEGGTRLFVVHGSSGVGKSGVLAELAAHLTATAVPFLALRLDRREPSTSSARSYGQDKCDLPESPAKCLAALAGKRPAVLILDQLDAIRWSHGHRAARWDVCREIIAEALGTSNIRVVLSLRSFDLRDDQEIQEFVKQKQARELKVGQFAADEVRETLEGNGESWTGLAHDIQEFLRLPQHLALWVAIPATNRTGRTLSTKSALMNCYWDHIGLKIAERGISDSEFRSALQRIVRALDRTGELFADPSVLTGHFTAKEALLSQHVLALNDGKLSFTHQSYFDHLLAREVVDSSGPGSGGLSAWLMQGDQSLMRRQQLRLALELLRSESPGILVDEARRILLEGGLRFHLKQVVLLFLGGCEEPTASEITLACELLADDNWRPLVLHYMCLGNAPWFNALSDRDYWTRQLDSTDDCALYEALNQIQAIAKLLPGSAARLLRSLASRTPEHAQLAARALPFDPIGDDAELFALRMQLTREGHRSAKHDFSLDLVEASPLRAIELLEVLLDKRRAELPQEGWSRGEEFPIVVPRHLVEAMQRLVALAPEDIWQRLAPWVASLAEAAIPKRRSSYVDVYFKDTVWEAPARRFEESGRDLREFVAEAGGLCAARSPDVLRTTLSQLIPHGSLAVQQLVAMTWANCPPEFANMAIDWIQQEPARLSLGDFDEPDRWRHVQKVISAFATSCSRERLAELEASILAHYSRSERASYRWQQEEWRTHGRIVSNQMGQTQLALLQHLPKERISRDAHDRLGVLVRKFGDSVEPQTSPRRVATAWKSSPIRPESLSQLSDKRWLDIIHSDLPEEDRRWRGPGGPETVSDVRTFSRQLFEQCKKEPQRFCKLALQIRPSAHPDYVASILAAIPHDSPADDARRDPEESDLKDLLERIGYTESREVAMALCRVVRSRPGLTQSARILSVLNQYVRDHPDPKSNNEPETKNEEWDLESAAINCVRGCACAALAGVLFEFPEKSTELHAAIESAAHDPSPAVRVAALALCLPIWNIHREDAVDLFTRIIESTDDRVLSCNSAVQFLSRALQHFPNRLDDVLRRMLGSPAPRVVELGAQCVAMRWLHQDALATEILACKRGTPEMRLGLAKVAAEAVSDPCVGSKCVELLRDAFHDQDEQVRKAAAGFLLEDGALDHEAVRLAAKEYVASPALLDGPDFILHELHEYRGSLVELDDVVFGFCDAVAGTLAPITRHTGAPLSWAIGDLVGVLLRMVDQASQENAQGVLRACLDRWDALLEARVGPAVNLIRDFDVE